MPERHACCPFNNLEITLMKPFLTFCVVLAVIFAAVGGHAQVATKRGHRGQGQAITREDIRPMKNAYRLCVEAQQLLRRGLPIYDGHRVKAIQWDQIAALELRAGILWNKANDPTPNRQQQIGKSTIRDNEPKSKYSAQQIAESNKRLQRAGELLTKALAILKPLPNEYGGHRAEAMRAIDNALKELTTALGGTQTAQP